MSSEPLLELQNLCIQCNNLTYLHLYEFENLQMKYDVYMPTLSKS